MSDITYDGALGRWLDAEGERVPRGDPRLDNRFRSKVGKSPTFFVPDTGAEGGTATLTTPKGKETTITEVVLSPESEFGPRIGFKVPVFEYEGTYTLTVDDGSEFVIDVEAVAEEGE